MRNERGRDVRKCGSVTLDLAKVCSVRWEGDTLYVHFDGGNFLKVTGEDARAIHDSFLSESVQGEDGTSSS